MFYFMRNAKLPQLIFRAILFRLYLLKYKKLLCLFISHDAAIDYLTFGDIAFELTPIYYLLRFYFLPRFVECQLRLGY